MLRLNPSDACSCGTILSMRCGAVREGAALHPRYQNDDITDFCRVSNAYRGDAGSTAGFPTFSDAQFHEVAFQARLTSKRAALTICIYRARGNAVFD
jgi:hypothetical protein